MSTTTKKNTTKNKKSTPETLPDSMATWSKSSMTSEVLKFYRTNKAAQLPVFATKQSACFDIYANLINGEEVQYYQAIATKVLPRKISFDSWLEYLETKQVKHFPKCKKQWLFIKKVKEDPIARNKRIYASILR